VFSRTVQRGCSLSWRGCPIQTQQDKKCRGWTGKPGVAKSVTTTMNTSSQHKTQDEAARVPNGRQEEAGGGCRRPREVAIPREEGAYGRNVDQNGKATGRIQSVGQGGSQLASCTFAAGAGPLPIKGADGPIRVARPGQVLLTPWRVSRRRGTPYCPASVVWLYFTSCTAAPPAAQQLHSTYVSMYQCILSFMYCASPARPHPCSLLKPAKPSHPWLKQIFLMPGP
jgi:hypothetical protein